MKKTDIQMFTEEETRVIDNSFDRESLPSRFRNIILGAFFATAVALGLMAYQASAGFLAGVAILYVAIAALEKVSYVRTQMHSRAAIRKLVHRIERLEGVPVTPDNAQPSRLATSSSSEAA